MKKYRFLLTKLAAAFALIAVWPLLSGYNLMKTGNGSYVRWPKASMPIGWLLNENDSDDLSFDEAQSALQKAFDAWDAAPCADVAFEYKGPANVPVESCGTGSPDRKNVMVWQETAWPAEWKGAIAIAVPVYAVGGSSDGQIVDADIIFDGVDFKWSASVAPVAGKMDLQNVAAHEIGHLLGLSHPGEDGTADHPESTMYPKSTTGEIIRRYMSLDDIQGLCKIYPVAGADGSECILDSVCSSGKCGADPGTGALFCTRACSSDADCPGAFKCDLDEGFCVAIGGAKGSMGASCAGDFYCKTDKGYKCMKAGDDSNPSICTRACPPECPGRYVCLAASGGTSHCASPNLGGQILGEVCDLNSNPCSFQFNCLSITNYGTRCSQDCSVEKCPSGFDCLTLTGPFGSSKACWPSLSKARPDGAVCSADSSCASSRCAANASEGKSRCSSVCQTAAECEAGYDCLDVTYKNAAAKGCWPANPQNGSASISSFVVSDITKDKPPTITISCSAESANGTLYQFHMTQPGAASTLAADWSPIGVFQAALSAEGVYSFICNARDKFSGEYADDRKALYYNTAWAAEVVSDGDFEDESEITETADKPGGGSSGGCAAGSGAALLAIAACAAVLRGRKYR